MVSITNDDDAKDSIMYYIPREWYEYTRKPEEAVYVHTCKHTKHLLRLQRGRSTTIPTEVMMYIRNRIDDAETLAHFDIAIGMPRCKRLVCLRLAEQHLITQRFDVLSFGELEQNKATHNPNTLLRHSPTFYVIQVMNDSIRMYSLKKYTRGYLYDNVDPLFTDPVTLSQAFITFTLHIAYDPKKTASTLGMNKDMLQAIHPTWIKVYKAIKRWAEGPMNVRLTYIGFEGTGWNQRGRTWIYPETRYYRPSTGISFMEHIKRPCREWVDYLYALSKFQKKHSPVLNKLYMV